MIAKRNKRIPKVPIILLVLVGWLALRGYYNNECELPTDTNRPNLLVGQLIQQLGGLPQQNLDYLDLDMSRSQLDSLPIAPIKDWAITDYTVNNRSNMLVFDDPIHQIEFKTDITFADHATAQLTWQSWNYGQVFCPFVIREGSGPLGGIRIQMQ